MPSESERENMFLCTKIGQSRIKHPCHHQLANDRKLVDMAFVVCLSRSLSDSLSSRENFVYGMVGMKEDASISI
jgi:hypothetical protein